MKGYIPVLVLLLAIGTTVQEKPGDNFVNEALTESKSEVNKGLKNSLQAISDPNAEQTPAVLLKKERFPSEEAQRIANAEDIIERTINKVKKKVKELQGDVPTDVNQLISPEALSTILEESNCVATRQQPDCSNTCYHSRYRTINGTCNNVDNPLWGASDTPLDRILDPFYEDGFHLPRGWSPDIKYHNLSLPSARHISLAVVATAEIEESNTYSHWLMQHGQFIDHDIGISPLNAANEGFDSGISCDFNCNNELPCFPIPVPENDPRIKTSPCIGFVRSSAACPTSDTLQPRQQLNELTSFIDCSNVYGARVKVSERLIDPDNPALLRTGEPCVDGKCLLPFDEDGSFAACLQQPGTEGTKCFLAGDLRANEQIALTATHTIWMREHNRVATKLQEINPHWVPHRVFLETKKIVIAEMQHITYYHWLPKLLGRRVIKDLKIKEETKYDPTCNPSLFNSFSTAAYRLHILINAVIQRYDSDGNESQYGHLPLHQAFFSPWRIVDEGGVEPLIRGLLRERLKKVNAKKLMNSELTEKLFALAVDIALDLAALNIQRGRDHGLPTYFQMREHFGLSNDLSVLKRNIKPPVLEKLQNVYGDLRNVDLWVGGICEKPYGGGQLGELFYRMNVLQYKRLRDCDRFYYKNPGVFTQKQLNRIKRVSLSRIICDNTIDITEIQKDAFRLPSKSPIVKCEDLPSVDLSAWKDDETNGEVCPE